MNKPILAIILAMLCGAAAVTLPVLAQTAPTQPAAPQVTATSSAKSKAKTERPVPAPGTRQCLRDTGSHIPPPKGHCLPVAGSSYSQQDIQRTGATNVGQALQMLDPSVTVHGH